MTSQAIANAIDTLNGGRVVTMPGPFQQVAQGAWIRPGVVDLSPLHASYQHGDDEGNRVRDGDRHFMDMTITSPWEHVAFAWTDNLGVVVTAVTQQHRDELPPEEWAKFDALIASGREDRGEPTFVQLIVSYEVLAPGLPLAASCFAYVLLDDQGYIVGLGMDDFIKGGMDLIVQGVLYPAFAFTFLALDLLNCSNIHAVESQAATRQQRRQYGRKGIRLWTLQVYAPGKKPGNGAKGEPVGGMPLTTVRGSYAEYGARYGKGLLFGKLEGRFWRPGHAKGDKANGEVIKDYEVLPAVGATPLRMGATG